MKMIDGVHFKQASKLKEEFEVFEKGILANISAPKIEKIFYDFLELQKGPLFLIIEVPTNFNDEKDTENGTHKDVYYADGLNKEEIYKVMNEYGHLLINDGLVNVGIGNHNTNSEIMTLKYNMIQIFSVESERANYEEILKRNHIKKTNKLVTAWDYFTIENPGTSSSISINNIDIYKVIDILKVTIGLYYSERRGD